MDPSQPPTQIPLTEGGPVAATQFLRYLNDSGLLPADEIRALTAKLSSVPSQDGRQLAQELVRQNKLTHYQASMLLKGKSRGLVLGNYVILEKLGQGGMGMVFKAQHRLLNRISAVKVLPPSVAKAPRALKRFQREMRVAVKLAHPNIVAAFDADEAQGVHFLAMEYVEGSDLSRLVKSQGPLPVGQAVDCIIQAARGLAHAHAAGIVHRDIKPSNLLLDTKGILKVLDLGLARIDAGEDGVNQEVSDDLTHDGNIVGTSDYMAPEQALNTRTADRRADIYSLGCTLYYLLTGKKMYPGGTVMEKVLAHRERRIPSLRELRPDVPTALDPVFARMVAKTPEQRQQSMEEVAAQLEACQVGGAGTRGIPVGLPLQPRSSSTLRKLTPGHEETRAEVEHSTADHSFPSRPRRVARYWWWAGGLALAASGALLIVAIVLVITSSNSPTSPTNSLGGKLALIPAGTFTMGSPDSESGRRPDEGPQHTVTITRAFLLGVHPVNVGEFRSFVTSTGYRTDAEREGTGAISHMLDGPMVQGPQFNWQNPGWPVADSQPVVCVSWADAVAFCDWLTKKEGRRYRLPTEAEWEYACRGGTSTPFHHGPSLSSRQDNIRGNSPYGGAAAGPSVGKVSAVGAYPANPFGLHDLHGNVLQWCADWYDPGFYRQSPKEDPTGPTAGKRRVFRGGCWTGSGANARSAFRAGQAPGHRANDVGFRVAADLPEEGRKSGDTRR